MNAGVFLDIHRCLPQEAPGSDASTRRALSMVPRLSPGTRILDIGCGPGRQTIALARSTRAWVTAVDTHRPYLEELEKRAQPEPFSERIQTVYADMAELYFPDEAFDLVWSEGAAYIIGFHQALRSWKRLLRPRGCIAVSELSWLTGSIPPEAQEFWDDGYPAMSPVEENVAQIERAGYKLLGKFTLPEKDWWDGYYGPLEARIKALEERYSDDPVGLQFLAGEQAEIDLFRKFSKIYGYVFYVAQRTD